VRRHAFLTAAVASLSMAILGSASARPVTDYVGSARRLLPTAATAKYDRKVNVSQVNYPSARFLSAWRATYLDRGPGAPRATMTVYVYPTASLASAAYDVACPADRRCTRKSLPGNTDIELKAVNYRQGKGRCTLGASFRRTVFVRVTACAAEPGYGFTKLRFDAGYLMGVVYGKVIPLKVVAVDAGVIPHIPAYASLHTHPTSTARTFRTRTSASSVAILTASMTTGTESVARRDRAHDWPTRLR
jgi:hypothetical protein